MGLVSNLFIFGDKTFVKEIVFILYIKKNHWRFFLKQNRLTIIICHMGQGKSGFMPFPRAAV